MSGKFAKKYGLEGEGHPKKISEETKKFVSRKNRENDRVVQSGKDWAKQEKRTYGD